MYELNLQSTLLGHEAYKERILEKFGEHFKGVSDRDIRASITDAGSCGGRGGESHRGGM